MGQSYRIVNLDKKEYLHPHHCGGGYTLLEFGDGDGMAMTCLAVLLATSNGQGGGDLFFDEDTPEDLKSIPGRWAGNRIAVVGEYSEGKWGRVYPRPDTHPPSAWTDISFQAVRCICEDEYLAREFEEKIDWFHLFWKEAGEPLPRKCSITYPLRSACQTTKRAD